MIFSADTMHHSKANLDQAVCYMAVLMSFMVIC